MAWDFSTEPEFEQQLDWMRTFVREEIWPLETVVGELDQPRSTASTRRCKSRSRSVICGRRTWTPSSGDRASGR